MRFYRGNEYGYEISQKNGSWYHRVTWLHVVSPVLENDNEEERSTWNRGKPAFDKLDSIKQHFFHFLLSSALNYDVDSSFSSWLPSSRVGWYSFPRRAIRILRKIHLHFIRCGACCFLRGICVLRRCSILSVASRSWLVKRSRSDPKHVTVVCWNFARRSGVDLPRETVQSFPLYMHYSHPHARWALPHRDFDRSFGGRVRRFNDRCHFPVDLSILVSTKPRFAPTSVPVYTIYWSRKKNATIYYRIRGEYVAVSKLQLYIHGMSRTDCTCTVSNVPKTRDPSAIGQQSSLVTDLAQIHRLSLCIITVASSSEDGPGTIRNFEKLFPLFWKKTAGEHRSASWDEDYDVDQAAPTRDPRWKKVKWRAWRFSRSCASRGKHQKRSESDRSFLRVESVERGKKKNCTRERIVVDRALLTRVTVSRIDQSMPLQSLNSLCASRFIREDDTKPLKKTDRHDAARHGTATRLSKRRNDSSGKNSIHHR